MIQLLASRYRKKIAWLLLIFFDCSFTFSAKAGAGSIKDVVGLFKDHSLYYTGRSLTGHSHQGMIMSPRLHSKAGISGGARQSHANQDFIPATMAALPSKAAIGGPSQPEMASFKPIDDKNLVNLFTGDFNYNIPLLDVGGYPVNIFYNGEVGVEQEASWVGLGWNINPGNVSRGLRGVPDDFDGTDTLVQIQNMKPNKTWGVSIGADVEGFGIKLAHLGDNVGVSFNNYLGIALDFGFKGGVSYRVGDKVLAEKNANSVTPLGSGSLNLNVDINSRQGLTISPAVSLGASAFKNGLEFGAGIGLSTSYNSRSGIKALQFSANPTFTATDPDDNTTTGALQLPTIYTTSISFVRPSYIPEIRMPMSYTSNSYHLQAGTGYGGGYISLEGEYYQQSTVVNPAKIIQYKPLVGFLYSENAMNNPDAVMDFSRLNDQEVTPKTPVISAPEYTYDVFSIQGEETGGSIRAYRNDLGYVRDNTTGSSDNNLSLGADVGFPGHYGVNINTIHTPSTIGEWQDGNMIKPALAFQTPSFNKIRENVYFRNPGETTVLDSNQFARLGGTSLVRFQLAGSQYNPVLSPTLQLFNNEGAFTGKTISLSTDAAPIRQKRKQVVSFLTAEEASIAGLDKVIKSYDDASILDATKDTLLYDVINRVGGYRKAHHISEVDVTEANGKRYIYGLPVYNVTQRDLTFTVTKSDLTTPNLSDKVNYDSTEACATKMTGCPLINGTLTGGTGSRDGYVEETQTPAYAHSFLLSGLLSPDYVDMTGDGISDDDLGNAVKFNYTRVKNYLGWYDHKWRTPADNGMANFNPGSRSNVKDDKGLVNYGQRESWYLHSIESKTMIAIFVLQNRSDGKGAKSAYIGVDPADSSLKSLKEIDLYSKSDLGKNGLAKAKPIKTVHFVYDYSLCPGTPDNPSGGKLTLQKIYFTYNGQDRYNKEQYVFSYTDSAGRGNPAYEFNASDRWGTYKPAAMNPGGMRNSQFPYTIQSAATPSTLKDSLDAHAGAWALKRILLPSGGQLEVKYESDDYAFVQNKRASDMIGVVGFGTDSLKKFMSPNLYGLPSSGAFENDYMFISVPQSVASKGDVYRKYLLGLDQIAVRMAVNMPSGLEYVTAYTTYDNYGFADSTTIWVHMINVDGYSPLSLSAIEFLKERLPGDAFPGYDVSESGDIVAVASALKGMLDGIESAFTNVVSHLRSEGKAKTVLLSQTYARLNDPDGAKYGGGQRVKSITLKDNWNAMKSGATSSYTQVYDYTTTETFGNGLRTISSGVASYEPTLGGEENPFHNIFLVENNLPAGPASYGAIENPVLDGLFQAPSVGYSKVTVRSLPSVRNVPGKKSRSAIGRQETLFYTAKDYPVSYNYTPLTPDCDKEGHDNSTTSFFTKYAFDSRAISQGFLVSLNDMHGKMLSQTSYAANDTTVVVNYTQNFYRNTGVNGLNEKFDFVHASHGDTIEPGNMGVDIELMTDTREFNVSTSSEEWQLNLDELPVIPFPIVTPLPVIGNSQNIYRAVTTTKVINYHAVLDSVVVFDKGSVVSTRNLLYDGETGDVIVTRTNNEFNQPTYSTSYPARWAYSGMGAAAGNIGMQFSGINIYEGKITNAGFDYSRLESGDELYVSDYQLGTGCYSTFTSGNVGVIWAFDRNKATSPLTATTHDFIFIDQNGSPFTDSAVSLKIIRSGKRNLLDQQAAMITSMVSPIVSDGSNKRLKIDSNSQVINASAVSYKEKWQTDRDVIQTYSTLFNSSSCLNYEAMDCAGHLEKTINPYRRGLLGNFQNERSLVYYGSRKASDTASLSKNGFINAFSPYWGFDVYDHLVPDTTNANWVWKDKITRINSRGMQLETQDALGIYTSALYGYNKNLPTAICNNATYFETAYEGFEDNGYANFLNGDSIFHCSNQQHLDLSSMANSKVLNTDSLSFGAHTGKYLLGVNPHSQAKQTFAVIDDTSNYNYQFNYGSGIHSHLDQLGGNASSANVTPSYQTSLDAQSYVSSQAYFESGDFAITLWLNNNVNPSGEGIVATKRFSHSFATNYDYYISVASPNDYTFNMHMGGAANTLVDSNDRASVTLLIYDLNGNVVTSQSWSNTGYGDIYGSTNVHLCDQIYHVFLSVNDNFVRWWLTNQNTLSTGYVVTLGTNAADQDYKSLSTLNDCPYVTAAPASDSMLNPKFSIPKGKRMLISAWVHEDSCGVASIPGAVCNQTLFSNGKIIVNAGGADSTLSPTGPIIEGWQRFEGYITARSTGTAGYITFSNTSGNMIYFDDIRIHPYNANMKTYIYDPFNLRLVAESDANNYGTFYEYDAEGTLIRTKAETREGIKTVTETRSAKQKGITTITN